MWQGSLINRIWCNSSIGTEQWNGAAALMENLSSAFPSCASFSGFAFSLDIWAISHSVINEICPMKFMSFSHYKIASDKGILPPPLQLSPLQTQLSGAHHRHGPFTSRYHASIIIINDFLSRQLFFFIKNIQGHNKYTIIPSPTHV